MSTKYKFIDSDGRYFVSFATVSWVDVFTRLPYIEIFTESIRYCQQNKGINLHAWCLMSNHVHLVFSRSGPDSHSDIVNKIKEYSGIWSSGHKLQTCDRRKFKSCKYFG